MGKTKTPRGARVSVGGEDKQGYKVLSGYVGLRGTYECIGAYRSTERGF